MHLPDCVVAGAYVGFNSKIPFGNNFTLIDINKLSDSNRILIANVCIDFSQLVRRGLVITLPQ